MWVRENRTKGAIARLRFFEPRGGSIVAAVALTALLCDGLAPLLSFFIFSLYYNFINPITISKYIAKRILLVTLIFYVNI